MALANKERLAQLAKALDQRAKAAVAAEKERAMAREAELQGAIDAINNEENGILAQAKAHVAEEIEKVNGAAEELAGRMDGAEADIDALQADVERLDGAEDVEGSVKKQIADAKANVEGQIEDEKERAEAREAELQGEIDALEAVVGNARVEAAEGVEAQEPTGLHKAMEDADKAVEEAAKAYADEQIAALVDSAPDALNTLRELAEAIKENQDIYDEWVGQHTEAMNQMKADLQAEIDADVKVEKDRAEAREAELQGEIDAVEGRMDAAEADIDALQAAVGNAADGENAATGLHLAVNNAQAAADQAQDEVDAVEERMTAAEGRLDAIDEEQDAQDQRMADIEAVVGKEAEGEDAATGIFAKIAEMQAEMDQNEADFDEAMQAEVEARNAAIEAALEPYSTTEEVKAILGNVVSTLDLSMADDKMVLKLGGAEGIALTEVSLDVVTEADIDEIIASLDEEEPQA